MSKQLLNLLPKIIFVVYFYVKCYMLYWFIVQDSHRSELYAKEREPNLGVWTTFPVYCGRITRISFVYLNIIMPVLLKYNTLIILRSLWWAIQRSQEPSMWYLIFFSLLMCGLLESTHWNFMQNMFSRVMLTYLNFPFVLAFWEIWSPRLRRRWRIWNIHSGLSSV